MLLVFMACLFSSNCHDILRSTGTVVSDSFDGTAKTWNMNLFNAFENSKKCREYPRACSNNANDSIVNIFSKCGLIDWISAKDIYNRKYFMDYIPEKAALQKWESVKDVIINDPRYWSKSVVCSHFSEIKESDRIHRFPLDEKLLFRTRDDWFVGKVYSLADTIIESDTVALDQINEMRRYLDAIKESGDTIAYKELVIGLNLSNSAVKEYSYTLSSELYSHLLPECDSATKTFQISNDIMLDLHSSKRKQHQALLLNAYKSYIEKHYNIDRLALLRKFKKYSEGKMNLSSLCEYE